MSDFILNIIHRPEMVPEYAEKITGQSKTENIADTGVINESLDIFITQQKFAHDNGLKTTIQMTYSSLFNEEAIDIAKHDHEVYGDEIGLTLLGLPCKQFRDKYKTKEFCIWMFESNEKKRIIDDVFTKFFECFGFYPESTGSYYLDAESINYIKNKYPSVKCAVATCWEEGPKAYHTCNNSWYTLMDGGPWAPWIPSKQNTHAPAANKDEDSGIVAIPHLSRDLLACYDGNGSNFGTHPQNVLRGMIYDTKTWEFPYFYNLVDQYRYQEKFNNGYSYNMMFVGPGWMNKMGRWEQPYELLLKSYQDGCKYYGDLKKQGKLIDMTMSEFADYYRNKKHYEEPECALWRDILYGSNKQLFWYTDPYMRVCVNMDQGGAIVDLRPYVSKLEYKTGVGSKHIQDVSYPYLIQEKYRAGYFTHYAGEGTIRSAKVCADGQEIDLCLCRTHGHVISKDSTKILELDPVEIEFKEFKIKLVSTITFKEGSSEIVINRKIIDSTNPNKKVTIKEYIVACYGTNEYSEDMSSLILRNDDESINYEYKCREIAKQGSKLLSCDLPQINTKVSFKCNGNDFVGIVNEGYAFSPMFKLEYDSNISIQEDVTTWLKLEKLN